MLLYYINNQTLPCFMHISLPMPYFTFDTNTFPHSVSACVFMVPFMARFCQIGSESTVTMFRIKQLLNVNKWISKFILSGQSFRIFMICCVLLNLLTILIIISVNRTTKCVCMFFFLNKQPHFNIFLATTFIISRLVIFASSRALAFVYESACSRHCALIGALNSTN